MLRARGSSVVSICSAYPGGMSRPHRRSWASRALAVLTALATVALVASCAQLKDQASDVVEHAIEDAVDGLELSDGLPQDFPLDQVPVVEGPTQSATKTDSDGAVKIVVLVSAQDAGTRARDRLTDAGLEVDHEVTADAGLLAQLSGHGHDVTLIASGSQVVYVVTQR